MWLRMHKTSGSEVTGHILIVAMTRDLHIRQRQLRICFFCFLTFKIHLIPGVKKLTRYLIT